MTDTDNVRYMDDGTPYAAPTEDAHPFMWNQDVVCKGNAALIEIARFPEPVYVDDVIVAHCGPFAYRHGIDEAMTFSYDPHTWELLSVTHTINGEPVEY